MLDKKPNLDPKAHLESLSNINDVKGKLNIRKRFPWQQMAGGTLLIVALGFLAGLYLPWWSVAIIALLVSAGMGLSPAASFSYGFAAAILLWGGYATFLDSSNMSALSTRMGGVFGISGAIMARITAVLGGLVGGLGAWAGAYLAQIRS